MNTERDRAWRRFKDRVNAGKGMGSDTGLKPEKNWKHLYQRRLKMLRAKQLGFDYPIKNGRQLLDKELPIEECSPINLLFICSRNQWRSPTGEAIFRRDPNYNARSAGTSPKAKRTVSAADISWADRIFVMEKKHKNRLVAQFTRMLDHKPVHILDIPDDYGYMDEELISEIEARVEPFLSA